MNDRLKAYAAANVLVVAALEPSIVYLTELLYGFGLFNLNTESKHLDKHFLKQIFNYDLIFFDLSHTQFEVNCQHIQNIRATFSESYLPIVGLLPAVNSLGSAGLRSANESLSSIKEKALHSGITDFITLTDDAIDVSLRLSNVLEAQAIHKTTQSQNHFLENLVAHRTDELLIANADLANLNEQIDKSSDEIFERLARAAEFRDDTTGKHTERVGNLAALIALRLGMPEDYVGLISKAARLHDLGKIGIPDSILLKPSRFTPEERELMMQHCQIGAELLSGTESELLNMAQRIAISHHEKWNGDGYPNNLVADNIPLEGRIVAVADVFDALSNDRPYKQAWNKEEVLTLLKSKRGIHFDPDVVDVLVDIVAPDDSDSYGTAVAA